MKIKRVGTYLTGFKYYNYKNGYEITDENKISDIKKLKIPPCYNNVVIINNKKILGYGYDSKGRKQVIYNSKYIEEQNKKKYDKIERYDKLFIKIKKHISKDLKSDDEKNKIIAIIITLILTCGFRIGNKIYEKQNKSYGITTLNYSHIKLFVENGNNCVLFDFVGKKGVRNTAICKNKHVYDYLSRKVNNVNSKNNNYIFEFNNKRISSDDVNNYLMDKLKVNITTKDLRTWNANNLFNKFLHKCKNEKNPIKRAIELTSRELHNTSNVCKKSYIDPKIIERASRQLAL
jgi:DNA topoisomerase-1